MSKPRPTIEGVLNAMLAELAPLAPIAPSSITDVAYLRVLERYVAGSVTGDQVAKVDSKTLMINGLAGRTPAVLVDYIGDRPLRATIGYKTAKVESTYIAICVADPARPNREKPVGAVPGIFQVCEDVRVRLGSRDFGFNMQPLVFAGIVVLAETPGAYAWGVKLTSRRHVNYTKATSGELLLTVNAEGLTDGAITDRYGNQFGMTVRF
jgi:hypothetical protein